MRRGSRRWEVLERRAKEDAFGHVGSTMLVDLTGDVRPAIAFLQAQQTHRRCVLAGKPCTCQVCDPERQTEQET